MARRTLCSFLRQPIVIVAMARRKVCSITLVLLLLTFSLVTYRLSPVHRVPVLPMMKHIEHQTGGRNGVVTGLQLGNISNSTDTAHVWQSATPDESGWKDVKTGDVVSCNTLMSRAQRGPIEADSDSLLGMKQLEAELTHNLQLGGHYVPQHCRPSQKVAVVIPYRDRASHLKLFLQHMHPFLQRQMVEYYIVVVEQEEGLPFNRGLLLNIGFSKMNKLHHLDCFIFHDVDLLPLDDRISYLCQSQPLHLSMLVDTLGDTLMYPGLFGGAVALSPEMMTKVNGFPNSYYGWGGEDDDMSYRIRKHGYGISRFSKEVSRYTMMRHGKEHVNQGLLDNKVEKGQMQTVTDGLNSLSFHLLEFQPLPLYTWILVRPNITSSNGAKRQDIDSNIDTTDNIIAQDYYR